MVNGRSRCRRDSPEESRSHDSRTWRPDSQRLQTEGYTVSFHVLLIGARINEHTGCANRIHRR
jgi:hypothetical protein